MAQRLVFLTLILLVIAGCGSGGDAATLVPTVTPFTADASTSTPNTSATDVVPTLAVSKDYENGLAALKNNDYLAAIDALTLAHANQRDNTKVGDKLAEAYHLYGLSLLSAAGDDMNKIREAFDAFTSGQQAAPADGTMYSVLEADLRQVTAYIEGQGALDSLDSMEADDLAARKEATEKAYAQLGLIKAEIDMFPSVEQLYFTTLLAMADLREQEGSAMDDAAQRKSMYAEAQGFCTEARGMAGDNEDRKSASTACMTRMEARMNPPTATPVPTKAPPATAKPAPPPVNNNGPKSFRGYIATGFQPGEQTGQNSSCVSGRVVFADGSPVAAAAGNINNGNTSLDWVANGNGEFGKCGLGWSNWAVVLYYIPAPGLTNAVSIPGVWVNGTSEQSAYVVFEGR